MSKKKSTRQKLLLNSTSALIYEVTAILCGLILPRMIVRTFGSEVNGLVNSIGQFLHIISFLDLGIGAVVQSALYKPLAENDHAETSRIIASAKKFFFKIALILTAYVVFLFIFYPFMAHQDFGWLFTALLVAAMSISYFAQYYFGVVDRLLLLANQEGYVQYSAQIITIILNTIACIVIIKMGASIQMVKLTTSLIYLARPVFLRYYVNRNYQIDRRIKFDGEPIKQKWNGVAQHVSYVVLTSTDNIVLTLFSTLTNVSIYSVYNLVIHGIKQLFLSMTSGVKALLGELWAKKEREKLLEVFGMAEFAIHTATVFVFACTWKLILPFVSIYMHGVTDAEYIQPVFAAVLILAHAVHCLRIPYNMLILVTGAYKESQNMHIITAAINLGVSILVVSSMGLVGVAVGTLIAMLYQTVWMILYDSKNNIYWPLKRVGRQIIFDIGLTAAILAATHFVRIEPTNYFAWFLDALLIAAISAAVIIVFSYVFYRKQITSVLRVLFGSKKHII